jgi:arylsulfatase A
VARFLWLLGTIIVGTGIAVGSWFGVRMLTHTVQAAPPGEETVVAQNQVTKQNQPAPRTAPRSAPKSVNDNEAPPDASRREPPKNFIGALRDSLDGATDLDMDKDEYLKTLDDAETEFERIKEQNRAALNRVNRRPPISIPQSPNFIVIDMPGLGYDDLAVFSEDAKPDQELDALAEAGLVFTHYYAASARPSANTCSLLTGLHSGRTRIRDNEPVIPLALDDVTLAEVLWRAGYSTGMAGQWRLGGADTSGSPIRQGFEEAWFTSNLADDASPVVWNGDRRVADDQQPADWSEFRTASVDKALAFVTRHRQQPFFLYLSLPIDGADEEDALGQTDEQLGLLTKAVSELKLVRETYFILAGFPGENLPASAAPAVDTVENDPIPEAPVEVAKAPPAIPLVEDLADEGSPPIIPGAKAPETRPEPTNKVIETDFSELQNGSKETPEVSPAVVEATDNEYVKSLKVREPLQTRAVREVAGLRGTLGEMYEGGLRAPLIVWTTRRPLGGVRNDVVAAWDLLPTLASLSYSQFVPSYINGASFADRLQVQHDTATMPFHTALYWESHGDAFARAFLYGKWKLIQLGEDGPIELYNLDVDPQESSDIADQQPELVEKLLPLLDVVRSKSRNWPLAGEPAADAKAAE